MLATFAIRHAHADGATEFDGITLAGYARNVTFEGLHGPVATDDKAEVLLEFNLWDYRSEHDAYEIVLQFSEDYRSAEARGTIRWPDGVPLEGDVCEFEDCPEGKPSLNSLICIDM